MYAILERPNAELSCRADSPTAKPSKRSANEPNLTQPRLSGQFQRDVMLTPLRLSSTVSEVLASPFWLFFPETIRSLSLSSSESHLFSCEWQDSWGRSQIGLL